MLPCNIKELFNYFALASFAIRDDLFLTVNRKMAEISGYTEEEFLKLGFFKLVHPEDRDGLLKVVNRSFMEKDEDHSGYQFRMIDSGGVTIYVRGFFNVVNIDNKPAVLGQLIDITTQKQAEEDLRLSEERYRELADSLPQTVFEMDINGNLTYTNRNALIMFGYTEDDFKGGLNALQMLVPEDRERVGENIGRIILGEVISGSEYTALRKDGSTFPVTIHSSLVTNCNGPVGLRGIVVDITRRKKMEDELRYLSLYDPLTGLYNRAYFEEEVRRLEKGRIQEIGVIVCDVDGLKLINDTMGHSAGDSLLAASAAVIRDSFQAADIVARVGGDEFAVLLPNCSRLSVELAVRRLKESINKYNKANPDLPLNISIGFATGCEGWVNIKDIIREADNSMNREKLHHIQSARSSIVQTLMKALEARDFITEGHGDRLKELVEGLAVAVGLPARNLTDLILLARFHDIGKVGIPDRILFKPGPLTTEEAAEMQRHSEIGYQIARSASDLIPIADWILKHHERWDGKGYPLGLKGEDIPLECRILSIADAYDAMTSDRPYRKAMLVEKAIKELERCSGSQFDPCLIPIFVDIVKKKRLTDNSK